jgi:hypothetical protein
MLMLTDNLTQTAPNTIANHRDPELARGDEANATWAGVIDHCRAERQQFAAPYQAASFYAFVF